MSETPAHEFTNPRPSITWGDLLAARRYYLHFRGGAAFTGWVHPRTGREEQVTQAESSADLWLTYAEAQEIGTASGNPDVGIAFVHSGVGDRAGLFLFVDVDYHPTHDTAGTRKAWLRETIDSLTGLFEGELNETRSRSGNGVHLVGVICEGEVDEWKSVFAQTGKITIVHPDDEEIKNQSSCPAKIEAWPWVDGRGRARFLGPFWEMDRPSADTPLPILPVENWKSHPLIAALLVGRGAQGQYRPVVPSVSINPKAWMAPYLNAGPQEVIDALHARGFQSQPDPGQNCPERVRFHAKDINCHPSSGSNTPAVWISRGKAGGTLSVFCHSCDREVLDAVHAILSWEQQPRRGRPLSDDPSEKTEQNRRSLHRADTLEYSDRWMRLPRQDSRETYDLERLAHFCRDSFLVVDDHVHLLTWRGLWERHNRRGTTAVAILLKRAYRSLVEHAQSIDMPGWYLSLVRDDMDRQSANHLVALNNRLGELNDPQNYPQIKHIPNHRFDAFAAHPVVPLMSGGAVDLTQNRVLTPDALAGLYLSARRRLAVDYDPSIRHQLADTLLRNHFPEELLDLIAFAFAVPASHHFASVINELSGAGKTTLFEWCGWATGSVSVLASPNLLFRNSQFTEVEIELCQSHVVVVDEADASKNVNRKGESIPIPFGRLNTMLADLLQLNPKGQRQNERKRLGIPILVAGGDIFVKSQQGIAKRLLLSWNGPFGQGARIPDDTRRELENSYEAHQVMLTEIVRRARAIYQRVMDPQRGLDDTIHWVRFRASPGQKPQVNMNKARVELLHALADPAVKKVRQHFREAVPGDAPMLAANMPAELRKLEPKVLSQAMYGAFHSETKVEKVGGKSTRIWTRVALFHQHTQTEPSEEEDGLVLCISCGDEGVPPGGG